MSSFRLADHEIGGAVVCRKFSASGRTFLRGDRVTGEQVREWPNRRMLHSAGFIELYPRDIAVPQAGERFIVNRGFGKFDVVEGRKLNADPLTKEQAEALAGTPRTEAA